MINDNNLNIEEKITKLLALAASDNPHEAKAALLKAQELMLKYNCSTVTGSNDKEVLTYDVNIDRKRLYELRRIAGIITSNFRTRMWYSIDAIHFLGFKEDLMATRYCFEFVLDEIDRCFDLYEEQNLLKYKKAWGDTYDRDSFKNMWVNGFTDGLKEAFEERANDPHYAVMLVTPKEVIEKLASLNLHSYHSLKTYHWSNDKTYQNGLSSGREVLNKRSIE